MAGAHLWIKHENHAPTGAFKVRGGITLIDWLKRNHPDCEGIITAARGNHRQSQARAAALAGALKQKEQIAGEKVGVILSGGIIDAGWMKQILDGKTPQI